MGLERTHKRICVFPFDHQRGDVRPEAEAPVAPHYDCDRGSRWPYRIPHPAAGGSIMVQDLTVRSPDLLIHSVTLWRRLGSCH